MLDETRKPRFYQLKKKLEKKLIFCRKTSQSVENSQKSSLLAKHFLSSEQIRKQSHIAEKTTDLKNNIRIWLGGSLRKPNFETKNDHFEKSHNAENCGSGDHAFFNIYSVAKYQKKGTFGAIQKFLIKVS